MLTVSRAWIFIVLFFLSCSTSQETIVDTVPKVSDQVDLIAQSVFENEQFPGMAVQVWHEGKVVYSKGFGYSDVENKRPVNPYKSQFRIGSISKPMTAAGLGLLYDRNKIYLDFPIQLYVPNFPEKEFDVTIRQLAGHLAGIRHYDGIEFMSNKFYATVEEGLEIFKEDPLLHEPGSKYAYSSYGWNLISAALEGASSLSFLEFMQTEVFERLDMNMTTPEFSNEVYPDRVSFYQKDIDGKNELAPQVDNSYKWAGGGFIASAHDVVKFARAHLEPGFLSERTLRLWTSSQSMNNGKSTKYGIGWRTAEDKKGRSWFGHGGGSVGGTSMMLIFPEEELIVVTVVNLSRARMNNLAFRIANQYLE